MPLSHLNRRRFCHVVGIIPGPSEPDNVEPYVQDLLEEFIRFGPAGECTTSAVWGAPCSLQDTYTLIHELKHAQRL
jgi:hypothetical protein